MIILFLERQGTLRRTESEAEYPVGVLEKEGCECVCVCVHKGATAMRDLQEDYSALT